ncbi:MAG: hypothetical protein WA895_42405 [Streptosporangiaceae bacterium]|jgi:uncharacterized protein YegL
MPDPKGNLLPVYVIVDESYSMSDHADQLNDGVVSLFEALRSEPMTAAKVRLCILGFSDDVTVRLGLSDVRNISTLPNIRIRTGTNYHAVFSDLATRIPSNVASLKANGYLVHRPTVFFMSDGQPNEDVGNEDWMAAYRRLTDRAQTTAAPNIIAFGMGEVWPRTILDVATRQEFAFIAPETSDVGASIAKFFDALTASVIESGRSMELFIEKPEGFRMAIDLV